MSNMIRRSIDIDGEHVSPLGEGRIDEGNDNMEVKLLYWPDKERFDKLVYKAVVATRGSDIGDGEFDPIVVEDAFSGGLNQCLEWVTVVFEISGVSRGLTHELVRTRKASFAQQSMRHTDMGNPNVRMPEHIASAREEIQIEWKHSIATSCKAYQKLVKLDMPYQDARTVLPIGTETYIIASYPLSVFLDTYSYRACYMFYPEIVTLFHRMKEALTDECPWLDPFILISCERTAQGGKYEHVCTYQGWEKVEGHCPLPWAKDDNRTWKSRKFGG